MSIFRCYVWLFALATLLVCTVSWATTTLSMSIAVTPASILAGGVLAVPESMDGTFTVARGAAQVIDGIELFHIQVGDARFSDSLRIHLAVINPAELSDVLSNPNAHINVSLWHEDPEGEHALQDNTPVSPDPSALATARLSRLTTTALLQPSITGQQHLYVLAELVVPGGGPPGQQAELKELHFWCEIR